MSGGTSWRATPGVVLLLSCALAPRVAAASAVEARTEAFEICAAAGDQTTPRICPDGAGGAWIAWVDARGGAAHVFATHLLSTGTPDPTWPPSGLEVGPGPGAQSNPRIEADGAGGAFVVWEDARGADVDLYAQHLLAGATADPTWLAAGVPVCAAAGDQANASLARGSATDAFVAWEDGRNGADRGIYATRLTAAGGLDPAYPPGGLAVRDTAGDHARPAVVRGLGGAAIVCYLDEPPGMSPPQIGVRRIAAGTVDPEWPGSAVWFPVADLEVVTASDGAGGLFLGRTTADILNPHIVIDHLGADGQLVALPRVIGHPRSHYPGSVIMAGDGVGGLALAWYVSYSAVVGGGPPYSFDLCTRGYDAAGLAGAGPTVGTRVATASPTWFRHFSVIADGAGGSIVAWEIHPEGGNSDVYVQHVLASGELDPLCPPAGHAIAVTPREEQAPELAADGAGGATVVWQDGRDATGFDIVGARLLGPSPTEVLVSLASSDASPGRVSLRWSVAGAPAANARVKRSDDGASWRDLGAAALAGPGLLGFDDRAVVAGARYGYRLTLAFDGRDITAGEAWITVPEAPCFALLGTRPNPCAGPATVCFGLAGSEPARLDLVDLAGRRVATREVGSLGAGTHALRLDVDARLPAGVYLLRLSNRDRHANARVVLVR